MKNRVLLGVNIDHVATIRQARRTEYPSVVEGALLAEAGGADGITIHLREDRRHIQDFDIPALKNNIKTRLNLEMAVTDLMIDFALTYHPEHCCFVPEKREELTTEGGLDVVGNEVQIRHACNKLQAVGIEVSLFIDPSPMQVEAAIRCGARAVEIHTGKFAESEDDYSKKIELEKITYAAELAHAAGLIVNAGHGLHYENVKPIAEIPIINELNIGHSIVAKALMVGMKEAVTMMRDILDASQRD